MPDAYRLRHLCCHYMEIKERTGQTEAIVPIDLDSRTKERQSKEEVRSRMSLEGTALANGIHMS